MVLVASAALAQERYSVTLRFDADDDPEVVTRQLAAMYRLQIESAEPDSSTIVVRANHSAVPLLRVDRRVVAVEAARPAAVATNARGFGAYAYDGAGNITQAGDDSFLYDTRGRIEKATISGIAQTFTYDRWGNITNIATTGEPDDAIGAGTDNRLAGATYDGSGNLLSYHGGTFIYDALNVVKESRPTGSNNRYLYLYTASNERIATIEVFPTGQRRSDWTIRDDTGKVLRRFHQNPSGTWSWTEDYIYRGSQLLAAEVPSSEKVRHFHLDHLGTPRLITGNGGAVIAERTYSAFGRALDVDSTPPPDERAQFTGHERDSFQLDYMHARYYDPMVGRFLSADPTRESGDIHNPQSWNRYAYVWNNPLNKTDPDGRVPVLWWAARTLAQYAAREIIGAAARTVVEGTKMYAMQVLSDRELMPRPQTLPHGMMSVRDPYVIDDSRIVRLPDDRISAPPDERGKAPYGDDGRRVEIHHVGQEPDGPLAEMTFTDHRGKGNFKKNHNNTGQEPSKIDRDKWRQTVEEYWKREWDRGRFAEIIGTP